MISQYDCLIAPVMTEKTMNSGRDNVYVFRINQDATKCCVARAVENIFKVKVSKVNLLNRSGKKKTFRGKKGLTKSRKIAIVRLSEGSINFEGGI